MIVLTGVTGTVGSRVAELLLARNEAVRLLCHGDAQRAYSRFGDQVEVVVADFDDPESIVAAFAGAHRIFQLTPGFPTPDVQLARESTLITSAVKAGVERVVKLSAASPDADSEISYVRVHALAERRLADSGLAYTMLRPAGFMQNLIGWARTGVIRTCAGDGLAAFVDARDIASVAVVALTEEGHEGKEYTLTGPTALSFDEMAAVLSTATGRDISHARVPRDTLIAGLREAGLPSWFAESLATQQTRYAAGMDSDVSHDITLVAGRPARSLDDFAREEFATAEATAH